MRLHRFLKESNIDLHFDPFSKPKEWRPGRYAVQETEDEDLEELSKRQRWDRKITVLRSLVDLLEPSGKIANTKKCLTDLRNREAKATTAFGLGVAMPHVRTVQAKGFAIGVAIAPPPGLWFDSIDGEPVRVFFPMVAPPHDDRYYLKVERALAGAFANEDQLDFHEALCNATSRGEVIYLLRNLIDEA